MVTSNPILARVKQSPWNDGRKNLPYKMLLFDHPAHELDQNEKFTL